jgi:hypothetical protein
VLSTEKSTAKDVIFLPAKTTLKKSDLHIRTSKINCANENKFHRDNLSVQPDTISPQLFSVWTNRWKRSGRSYMSNNSIEYFTFPMAEMTSLIAENPTTARFYMGMDSIGVNNFVPKLILVGTDGNGNPKITKGGHIYDVSTVCPRICDDN